MFQGIFFYFLAHFCSLFQDLPSHVNLVLNISIIIEWVAFTFLVETREGTTDRKYVKYI
jgi:hypothetical protein